MVGPSLRWLLRTSNVASTNEELSLLFYLTFINLNLNLDRSRAPVFEPKSLESSLASDFNCSVWPWASTFPSLSRSFWLCKMRR